MAKTKRSKTSRPPPHIPLLSHALQKIRSTPPRLISSPPTQPRRASVAIIIHLTPPSHIPLPTPPPKSSPQISLQDFFRQDWVQHPETTASLLYIRRSGGASTQENGAANGSAGTGGGGVSVSGAHKAKGTESHVAFPGGRREEDDENAMYTALRETWEEIGIDLAEQDWCCVGQLDDREITTSLGKRLLMILTPFVFLHLSPYPIPTDPSMIAPGTTLHWIPIPQLLNPTPNWSSVSVDISERLAPRHKLLRAFVKIFVGNMRFFAWDLKEEAGEDLQLVSSSEKVKKKGRKELKLWGLTLGMTIDLISYMEPAISLIPPTDPSDPTFEFDKTITPRVTSVFPRFYYWDVNFWIWVFGKRYREVVRGWEASMRSGGSNDRRINWSGQALSTFYAAVRKALLVVIVGRAIGVLAALGGIFWALWRRWRLLREVI